VPRRPVGGRSRAQGIEAQENTCKVAAQPTGCALTTKALEEHMASDGGYDDRDNPNPNVSANLRNDGQLVLSIPYAASGNREVVHTTINDAKREWAKVGIILDFVNMKKGDEGVVEIRGASWSDFTSVISPTSGKSLACDCAAASGIGGWVSPDFKKALINVAPNGYTDGGTGPHELGGHLLGLAHRREGVMRKGSDITNIQNPRRPTQMDADRLRVMYPGK